LRVPVALAEAALAAETVTTWAEGITAGAAYKPLAEIVPVAAEPPVTPFTCQVTAWLVVPVTVAVNCVVAPRRVEAAPATMTLIEGVEPPEVAPPELQPDSQPVERRTPRMKLQRTSVRVE
jgi:hypothetical protein